MGGLDVDKLTIVACVFPAKTVEHIGKHSSLTPLSQRLYRKDYIKNAEW